VCVLCACTHTYTHLYFIFYISGTYTHFHFIYQVFELKGKGTVAGCSVADGTFVSDQLVQVVREGEVVHEGKVCFFSFFSFPSFVLSEGR